MNGKPLGHVIREARISAGLSQEELARLMSERGFDWVQAIVSKTERGIRKVLWEEGMALDEIVGFSGQHDKQTVRDAIAYRRILSVIGSNENDALLSEGES